MLHAGGVFGEYAEDSTELESYGEPGPGRYVSIYANAAHAFMYVGGLRFDTVEKPEYDTRAELRQARPEVARLGLGAQLGDLDRPTPTRPMNRRSIRAASAACLAALAVALAGAPIPTRRAQDTTTSSPSLAAERRRAIGSGARPPARRRRSDVQSDTVGQALAAFAELLLNWTYRTLDEQSARRSRRCRSAQHGWPSSRPPRSSQADTTIARGRIWNSGQIVSIAGDLAQPGMWVIVTREQTGGYSQYEGLPACLPRHPRAARRACPAAMR